MSSMNWKQETYVFSDRQKLFNPMNRIIQYRCCIESLRHIEN